MLDHFTFDRKGWFAKTFASRSATTIPDGDSGLAGALSSSQSKLGVPPAASSMAPTSLASSSAFLSLLSQRPRKPLRGGGDSQLLPMSSSCKFIQRRNTIRPIMCAYVGSIDGWCVLACPMTLCSTPASTSTRIGGSEVWVASRPCWGCRPSWLRSSLLLFGSMLLLWPQTSNITGST